VLVVDDFTPADTWPPLHEGRPDEARLHWLTHPALRTLEIPLAPDLAVLVATLGRGDRPEPGHPRSGHRTG
jgi:hypothetical protein